MNSLRHLGVKNPQTVLSECKSFIDDKWCSPENRYILSREEFIIVSSYTYEDDVYGASPYNIINKKFWNNNFEDQIKFKKSYTRLLLRALRKLPRVYGKTVYRGVDIPGSNYKVGEIIEWKAFSSTSLSIKTTQCFLKDSKTNLVRGTLFEIHDEWGYSVSNFSKYNERGNFQINRTFSEFNITLFFSNVLHRNTDRAYETLRSNKRE